MEELLKKLGIRDLADLIREHRLRWYGHVKRSSSMIRPKKKICLIPVTCQKKLGQPARIFFFLHFFFFLIRVYVGPPVRDLPLFKIMFLIIFTFKYPSSLIVISPLPLEKSDQPDIFLGVAVIEKTYLSVAVLGEFLSTLFYVTFFLKFQLFGRHRVTKKM